VRDAMKSKKTIPLKISRAKDEGLSVLLEEIQLAIEWNRPSILLAVQKHKRATSKIELALERSLMKISQQVIHIRLGDQLPDFSRLLSQDLPSTAQVYFFTRLDSTRGDRKDAYRALNLHRETFIENRIRAVFWLTTDEASDLVRFAPDFWAFRHRVVEFASERTRRN